MGWSNEQTALLIEEYEKHACLHMVKHKDYHNKHLRSLALKKITERLQTVRPSVTEVDMQKKFLGLRTTYAIERKKVLASMHSGMGEDEVYKPASWYFPKVAFLNDSLEIRMHKSSFEPRAACSGIHIDEQAESQWEAIEASQFPEEVSENIPLPEEEYEILDDGALSMPLESETVDSESPSRTSSRLSVGEGSIPKKRKYTQKQMETKDDVEMRVLREVSHNLGEISRIQGSVDVQRKPVEDVFGEFVAMQLKKIKSEDVRNEVQYEIHGILRNALRNQK